LFQHLSCVRAGDRATEFAQRCRQLGISGMTMHRYRYAWAERAKTAGYAERFAQEALGHNSKAVHRAYAKRALVKIPSLEEYAQRAITDRDLLFARVKFPGRAVQVQPLPPHAPPVSGRLQVPEGAVRIFEALDLSHLGVLLRIGLSFGCASDDAIGVLMHGNTATIVGRRTSCKQNR
jgi:hypothetical protein